MNHSLDAQLAIDAAVNATDQTHYRVELAEAPHLERLALGTGEAVFFARELGRRIVFVWPQGAHRAVVKADGGSAHATPDAALTP